MHDHPSDWPWTDEDTTEPEASLSSESGVEQIAGIAARCFRGADGNAIIGYLRSLTLERALGPDATVCALRHLEGQRHLVRHLCQLIDLGRTGSAPSIPAKGSRA